MSNQPLTFGLFGLGGILLVHATTGNTWGNILKGHAGTVSKTGQTISGSATPGGTATPTTPGAPSGGGSVEQQIYQAGTQLGFNKAAIAGLIGNAYQESSLNPSLNIPGGRGLFSWNAAGGNAQAAQVQLGNVLQQMELVVAAIGPSGVAAMNAAGSPSAAAVWFEQNFERAGIPDMQNRINAANTAYSKGY